MFELKVLGLSEAGVCIDRGWPTRIISLVTNSPIPLKGDHHLIVDVDDVHVEDGNHATADMLTRILKHTESLGDDDRLLVHCFAGQSRSTAAAIGVLIQHGMTAQEAFDEVYRVRSMMIPNQLITKLIDDHFNLNGELITIVREHTIRALKKPNRSHTITDAQKASMKAIIDLFGD